MNNHFAKLFEIFEDQVLITKIIDEGTQLYAVQLSANIEGVQFQRVATFPTIERRDTCFKNMTMEHAISFQSSVKSWYLQQNMASYAQGILFNTDCLRSLYARH